MSLQVSLPLRSGNPQASGYQLRPYQEEALEAVQRELAAGRKAPLVALPTGTGKTVVFAHLPRALGLAGRMLVLAHREELLDQAAAKLRACNPGLEVGIEQGERRAGGVDVVVASVQTLHKTRLENIEPESFDLLVVDEAHHAVAPSYRRILSRLGAGNRIPCIGVTATPTRGDGVGLRAVFDVVAYEMDIMTAITQGWLVPICGHRINTGTDLSGVSVRAGEFVTRELSEAVDTDQRNGLIVRAYRELVPGRRALAFCVDVSHAMRLAEAFKTVGITAASVSGETPKDERKRLINAFKAGELQAMCNCNVLTEGFDDPGIGALLMARPTKSSLLYTQMVGRGSRLATNTDEEAAARRAGRWDGEKPNLQVLDFADLSSRHTLASAAILVGLPPEMALGGRSAVEVKKQLELIEDRYPWIDVAALRSVEDLEMVTTKIEFFKQAVPEELKRVTKLTWMPLTTGGYRLSLPSIEQNGRTIRGAIFVEPTHLDTWRVRYADDLGITAKGEYQRRDDAIRDAECLVTKDAKRVLDTRCRWREDPASEKQLALIKRLRIPVPEGLTKGQAAAVITMRLEGRR